MDWKKKLSSRKFWAAVAGLVAAVLVLFNVDEITTEKIIALITAEGTLVSYILCEGAIDKAALEEKDNEL